MYEYQEQKKELFSDSGLRLFTKIRDNVNRLLKSAGAVRMEEAMSNCSGDSWTRLACVDYMVELGELREITPPGSCAGQHRVFVKVE